MIRSGGRTGRLNKVLGTGGGREISNVVSIKSSDRADRSVQRAVRVAYYYDMLVLSIGGARSLLVVGSLGGVTRCCSLLLVDEFLE